MTRATEQISEGRFEARANERRGDELGRLGQAINRMAARLSGFVTGQKRFLGDIAHELCSPIARIQVALGILEQRADEKQQAYVNDLREEVEQMSRLVNELLSFSKAGLTPQEIKLEPVNLAATARRVLEQESPQDGQVQVQIPDDLAALAQPELLFRALANLMRNAVRYAGQAGPITVSASRQEGAVVVTVADQGPGVPEASLQQVFDPFFRGEPSRSRDTGGVGLGLAIVKTCVEACQGTVSARNRAPRGLEVQIILSAAR
jgi:two-component system sensor histidine kinase CpxA